MGASGKGNDMSRYSIGVDFGTESARTVLVDIATGEIIATAIHEYAGGVIDRRLPGSSRSLPPDWALQDPADWLAALEATIPAVLHESKIDPTSVAGIGIDFTACTVLPTTDRGTPLSFIPAYRDQPHAWTKLWKHHAAQPQADAINELAATRRESWLPCYGGKISSEWLMPKALQILAESPELYTAAGRIVEGADWVVWQLTGRLTRNACTAGYKDTWHKREGYPSPDYLQALHPAFGDLYQKKVGGEVIAPGTHAGGLVAAWARRTGLVEGTAVAAPIIDAHAAVLGGGVDKPGVLFMMMGTSTCHMLMAEAEVQVEGISGVVEDGILPGLFGYEAGQAGVGDIFGWFVENATPPEYHAEAEQGGQTLHEVLTAKAAQQKPGQNGLLALDWWNGCRSTLVDADLTGMLVGYTLATRAEEIYRALIEATAYGTRMVVEAFTDQGVPVESIAAGGGLTRNTLLMQIYADVTGREISVAGTDQASALGAAILGAVASGAYPSLPDAIKQMVPPPSRIYHPIPEHAATYELLYHEYCRLYDYFGRGENPVMKVLRRLRHRAE